MIGILLILVLPTVQIKGASSSDCEMKRVKYNETSITHANDGKKRVFVFQGFHANRFLISLLDLDLENRETVNFLSTPKEIIPIITGAVSPEMSATLNLRRSEVAGIVKFLKENNSVKWIGVESGVKDFDLVKRSIPKARKIRMLFEANLSSDIFSDKDQKIRDFVLAAYGIEIYLAVYFPELFEKKELKPLESDEILDRNEKEIQSLSSEFNKIKKEICPGSSERELCGVYDKLLQEIILDVKVMTEKEINDTFSKFPSSDLKNRMRLALVGAVRWVKLQLERDVGVALNISKLEGEGLVIYGRNHVDIVPNLKQLCEGRFNSVVPKSFERRGGFQ